MTLIKGRKLPTISAARLALRWLEETDAPALFKIFADPEVMRYWSTGPWRSVSEGVEYVSRIHRSFAQGSLFQWGVERLSCGSVVGTCTLAHIDEGNRRAELGFVLRRDCWGQGLMLEATRALLGFAFGQLEMHRIEADVDPRNASSIRLLEKLGFQREGFLRERWLVGNEINDSYFYGILRTEWATNQGVHDPTVD